MLHALHKDKAKTWVLAKLKKHTKFWPCNRRSNLHASHKAFICVEERRESRGACFSALHTPQRLKVCGATSMPSFRQAKAQTSWRCLCTL
jgi:hypothetical protein